MSEEMNQTNGIDEEVKKGGEDEKETKEAEKKYSDADLNEIINQKFAKWQEKQDKAVADAKAEAEKLAKMNADQKAQYEAEQKDKLIRLNDTPFLPHHSTEYILVDIRKHFAILCQAYKRAMKHV